MLFFKRKRRRALADVFYLAEEINEILYSCKRDTAYMPTKGDLLLFNEAQEQLWQTHHVAEHVANCMQKRARGEWEGARVFRDKGL